MARFLVTGGAGFIGSNLVRLLLNAGHRVVVFDNLCTGHLSNLDEVQGHFEWIKGDLRHLDSVCQAADHCDGIFHLGALGSVPRSVADPRTSLEVNVTGTLNVLEAARTQNVPRIVYSASSSAYGNTTVSPKSESLVPCPLSPYAASKLAGEHLMQSWHTTYGLETVSLRYFNVFGPRQDPNGAYAAVIPAFVAALLSGHSPIIYGDGRQTRDFCFVDNVTEANLLAMTAPANVCDGRPMNIACGRSTSLESILSSLQTLLNRPIPPVFQPVREGDVHDSLATVQRAHDAIGYVPRIFFEEGLQRTLSYYHQLFQAR